MPSCSKGNESNTITDCFGAKVEIKHKIEKVISVNQSFCAFKMSWLKIIHGLHYFTKELAKQQDLVINLPSSDKVNSINEWEKNNDRLKFGKIGGN